MKPKSRDHILTEEQIKRLIDNCKNYKETFLIRGLFYTGMRISEFIHLKKDWIDKEYEFISIPEQIKCNCYECYTHKTHAQYWKPKTKMGVRNIYIIKEVRNIIKQYFESHNDVINLIHSRKEAWRLITNIGKRSKIKVFPHSIRASYVTILVEKGVDPYRLTNIMGWSSTAPAISYIKSRKSDLKEFFETKW